MERVVLAGWLALMLLLAAAGSAQAASDLQMRRSFDGTWLVVGSGWRPGEQLVVSVGALRFPAFVDGAGDFEVPTHMTTYNGPVAVHHPPTQSMGMLALEGETAGPSPLALTLAQGLAEGAALTGLTSGLLLIGLGLRRLRQGSRS